MAKNNQRTAYLEITRTLASESKVRELTAALPSSFTVDAFTSGVCDYLSANPYVLEADPASLLRAIKSCAFLGLVPNVVTGHAYLVKYGRDAQLVVGYRGLIEIIYRSGAVRRMWAEPVFKADHFVAQLGTDPKIVHEPTFASEDFDDLIATYAVAELNDGGKVFKVASRAYIDKIRKESLSKVDKPMVPWNAHPVPMAVKTAVRMLSKVLPMSTERRVQHALNLDDNGERFVDVRDATIATPAVGATDVADTEDATIVPDETPPAEDATPDDGGAAAFEQEMLDAVNGDAGA